MTRAEAFGAIHDAARELASRDISLRICDAARAAETESIQEEAKMWRRACEAEFKYREALRRLADSENRADELENQRLGIGCSALRAIANGAKVEEVIPCP